MVVAVGVREHGRRDYMSESLKVRNGLTEVLETPKHAVSVSDLTGTFLTQTGKHSQPKLSEVSNHRLCRSHIGVYNPEMMPRV